MPFKSNADRRRHIPKQRHRVTNWAEYDAGLRGLVTAKACEMANASGTAKDQRVGRGAGNWGKFPGETVAPLGAA
jgi:hypothetical protein